MANGIVTLVTALLFAVLSSFSVKAHDAWIETAASHEDGINQAHIEFSIGHSHDKQPWGPPIEHISSFFSIGTDGVQSHLSSYRGFTPRNGGILDFPNDGYYVLALSTFHRPHKLPAEKFNAYVKEEGVTPIAYDRLRRGKNDQPGRENYSRFFKSIARIGSPSGAGGHVTKPVGFQLEIVPDANPFHASVCEPFPLTVLYKGQPASGATIHVNPLDKKSAAYTVKTNREGQAMLPALPMSNWYAHVVWASTTPFKNSDADYTTAFSSLSVSGDPRAGKTNCLN